MNMSINKKKRKFEEDYQKAYKTYQEQYNNLSIEVKEQTVDMLDMYWYYVILWKTWRIFMWRHIETCKT